MGFALTRQNAGSQNAKSSDKQSKRSPLAGWLGRKPDEGEQASIPAIDIAAGLNRVLRNSQASEEAAPEPVDDEPIRLTLTAIEAALYSIDQIREIIEQAYDVALSARNVEDAGGRALLAESYDELRLSVNSTIDNLDEQAGVLIGKDQRHIDVHLGGKAHYSISPTRLDASAKGLNLDPPRDAFATFDEITRIMEELDAATKRTDRAAAGYCRDAQFLIARLNGEERA